MFIGDPTFRSSLRSGMLLGMAALEMKLLRLDRAANTPPLPPTTTCIRMYIFYIYIYIYGVF